MKRSAGICEVAGLPVLKHSLGELGVAVYAGVHVMASTPNFLCASQSYGALLTDDVIAGVDTLPYHDGTLAVPHEKEAASFTFHDSHAIEGAYLPKR